MSSAAAGHFTQAAGEYRKQLLRYAAQRVRDPAMAEDMVQDALLAAVAGIDCYSGRSALNTWLAGILRHKMVDALRTAGRQRTDPVDPDTFAAPHGDPEDALDRRRLLEAIARGMDELPQRTASAFFLREVMGLSTDEICGRLGVSPNHCAVLLHRARRALRGRLEALEGAA